MNRVNTTTFRYFGLSSSGVTYKSGSTSYSSSSYQSGSGARDGDRFKDSYSDRDKYGEEKYEKDTFGKSRSQWQARGLRLFLICCQLNKNFACIFQIGLCYHKVG
jgi:hypothetical protein